MAKSGLMPRWTPCCRRTCPQKLWNVPMCARSSSPGTYAATRSFISSAALFVKVSARIRNAFSRPSSSKRAIRQVRTRVFPEPGPARTNMALSLHATASRCISVSSDSAASKGVVVMSTPAVVQWRCGRLLASVPPVRRCHVRQNPVELHSLSCAYPKGAEASPDPPSQLRGRQFRARYFAVLVLVHLQEAVPPNCRPHASGNARPQRLARTPDSLCLGSIPFRRCRRRKRRARGCRKLVRAKRRYAGYRCSWHQ